MGTEIGVIGSIVRGAASARLGATGIERGHDVTMHVRFPTLNVVALNVPAADVEAVDHLEPEVVSAG